MIEQYLSHTNEKTLQYFLAKFFASKYNHSSTTLPQETGVGYPRHPSGLDFKFKAGECLSAPAREFYAELLRNCCV